MILYTDHDPACCAVLNARVEDDSLPPGDVWCADVRYIGANDLREYSQVHLFAGMGGSPLGLAWAGWPAEWSRVCERSDEVSTIAKLREIHESDRPATWELAWANNCYPALLAIAEAAGKISRMVGAGHGHVVIVTAGECKELWDALAKLEEVEL